MTQPTNHQIIEALLFSTPQGLQLSEIAQILELDKQEIRPILEQLKQEYQSSKRAFELAETGGGFLLRTRIEYKDWVIASHKIKPTKLSPGSMETLSIIAYHQPATRADIEEIRGVDSSYAVKSLLGKELIRISGKKDAPGRPMLFVTTRRFLEAFALKKLSELPRPEEYDLSSHDEAHPINEAP